MIVIDASAVVEVLLDTDLGRRIEQRVWGDAAEMANAPHLLDTEVLQVLSRLVRSRRLAAEHANHLVGDLVDLDLRRHGHSDLLERAFEMRDSVTAYDAMYLALAEALGGVLLTCDAKLGKAHGSPAKVEVLS